VAGVRVGARNRLPGSGRAFFWSSRRRSGVYSPAWDCKLEGFGADTTETAAGELLTRSFAGVRRWSDAAAGETVRAGRTEVVGRRRFANGPSSASSSSSSPAKLRRLCAWRLGLGHGSGLGLRGGGGRAAGPIAVGVVVVVRAAAEVFAAATHTGRSAGRNGTTGGNLRSLGGRG
jgi:hypothetical protein